MQYRAFILSIWPILDSKAELDKLFHPFLFEDLNFESMKKGFWDFPTFNIGIIPFCVVNLDTICYERCKLFISMEGSWFSPLNRFDWFVSFLVFPYQIPVDCLK